MKNIDDLLYAPLAIGWRQICNEIAHWIDRYRDPTRLQLTLDRPRPPGALLLNEMAEAYHLHGQRRFWRTEYPFDMTPREFEFDGILIHFPESPFPAYGVVASAFWRSIEDANLITNTYTHYYIYGSYDEALRGLSLLAFSYP